MHERGHVDALPKNDLAPGVLDAKESAGAPARHAPAASRHPGEVAAPHPARRGRRRLPHVCRALLRLAGPPLRAAGKRPHCLGRFCRRRTGSHLPDVFKRDLGRRPKALWPKRDGPNAWPRIDADAIRPRGSIRRNRVSARPQPDGLKIAISIVIATLRAMRKSSRSSSGPRRRHPFRSAEERPTRHWGLRDGVRRCSSVAARFRRSIGAAVWGTATFWPQIALIRRVGVVRNRRQQRAERSLLRFWPHFNSSIS